MSEVVVVAVAIDRGVVAKVVIAVAVVVMVTGRNGCRVAGAVAAE